MGACFGRVVHNTCARRYRRGVLYILLRTPLFIWSSQELTSEHEQTRNTMAKGGKETVAKVYVPEKATCMPDKKVFLARAGARYAFLVKEKDFMERANRLFLEGFSHIDPVIYYITSDSQTLLPQLLPSIFRGVKQVTVFFLRLEEKLTI